MDPKESNQHACEREFDYSAVATAVYYISTYTYYTVFCPDLTTPTNGAVVYSDVNIPRDDLECKRNVYPITWDGSDPVCRGTEALFPVYQVL